MTPALRGGWRRNVLIRLLWLLALVVLAAGCGDDNGDTTDSRPWIEEDVTFPFGDDTLFGVLTLPSSDDLHPAIVLVTGAASTSTGVRDGTSSRALISFAHTMVLDGYAVLRYDPPGVGQSTGVEGNGSLKAQILCPARMVVRGTTKATVNSEFV